MTLPAPFSWWIRVALIVVIIGIGSAGFAQSEIGAGGAVAAAAETAEEPKALDVAEADRLVTILEDEGKRTELIQTLKSLAAAGDSNAAPAEDSSPVTRIRKEIDQRSGAIRDTVVAIVQSYRQLPYLATWFQEQINNPDRQTVWLEVLTHLALVLGTAFLAGWAMQRLLRRVWRRITAFTPATQAERLLGLGAAFGVRLLPIGVFVGTSYGLLQILDLHVLTGLVAESLALGIALVRAVSAILRTVLAGQLPNLRVLSLTDSTAGKLERGLRRIVAVGGYGYFVLDASMSLGMPWTIHGLLLHGLFLITLAQFIRLVVRHREAASRSIAAMAPAADGSHSLAKMIPWQFVAAHWHVGAIGYGLVLYALWAAKIPGGFAFLFKGSLVTVIAGFAAMVAFSRIDKKSQKPAIAANSDGPEESESDTDDSEGDLATAAGQSSANFALKVMVLTVATVMVAEAWGVGIFEYLRSDAGSELSDKITNVLLIVLLGYGIWRAMNLLLQNAIHKKDEAGEAKRSNRARTLLTIFRNVLFVLIAAVIGLLALGEMGVNLTPLLAGAGVIGLAIGFGSQKLVQDIITGFFILMEDTIAVGDVVTVAGNSGSVEAVTLRTLRLRAYDGQVHTIPYSAIETVSNFTKEFSYYVFHVGVGYGEDVDHVMETLREVDRDLRADRALRRAILEPLEISGLDQFADSAVVIKARIKTRPLQQWAIGREFNRRMKKRFDELGIEIPFPQRTLHLTSAEKLKAALDAHPKERESETAAADISDAKKELEKAQIAAAGRD